VAFCRKELHCVSLVTMGAGLCTRLARSDDRYLFRLEVAGATYDQEMARPVFRHYVTRRRRLVASILEKKEAQSCLDVGCGTGQLLDLVVERQLAVGIDLSVSALKIANVRYRQVNLIRADSSFLPFRDCSFELALTIGVLHHLPGKLRNALSELHRVIKPCGYVLADEPNGFNPLWFVELRRSVLDRGLTYPFSPALLMRTLRAHGFRVEHRLFYGFVPKIDALVGFFKSLEGVLELSPLSRLATRLLMVARKNA